MFRCNQSSTSSSSGSSTTLVLPPFYQQISGTGTFVLCDTTVTYSSTDIQAVAMACKVLNDNSLTPATNAQLTNLLQTVEFFENIGK